MKSKPIGVRFDEKKLELIKKEQQLTSPQQVLNWLLDNYDSAKTWNARIAGQTEAIKKQPEVVITTTQNREMTKYDLERRMKKLGF
jgi:hypothetical protein